jgi:hypothetical protein
MSGNPTCAPAHVFSRAILRLLLRSSSEPTLVYSLPANTGFEEDIYRASSNDTMWSANIVSESSRDTRRSLHNA